MTATVTWTVANLERTNDSDKVVRTVHYRVDAVDGDYTSGAYGTESFEGDASADDFVPFADLTEATVIGWVKDRFGADKVTQVEAQLQAHIDEQKSPAVVAELPWAE
jgi:hypothetical protein